MDPWVEAVIGRLEERLKVVTALHERNEEVERLAREASHRSHFLKKDLIEAINAMRALTKKTEEVPS